MPWPSSISGPSRKASDSSEVDAMRTRIAIVEDEPDIAEVLEYNLEREGYETFTVLRGDTAMESLRGEVPDLILLDLMLPGLDGLELCRLLKRDAATSGISLANLMAK